jgi:hypothetical protein
MKLTAPQTTDNRPPPHSQCQQLRSAYHRVLPLRKLRNPSVKRMSAGLST